MGKVWKLLLLLLVITTLVWLTTMWRWQSAQVDPSTGDVVFNLLVLPLALTVALVVTVWQVTRLKAYAAAPIVPAAAPAAAESAKKPVVATAVQERSATFSVLEAKVQLRSGAEWDGARAAIASGECTAVLDKDLTDSDGQAVFAARMPDLSEDATKDSLQLLQHALATSRPDAWGGYECPDEVVRTLSLLASSIGLIQEAMELHWPVLAAPPVPSRGAARGSAASASVQVPATPVVVVRVAIPSRWPALAQEMATTWLQQQLDPLLQAGLKAAGQSPAMASTPQAAVQVHVHAVASAEAFWEQLDQQLLQWRRGTQAGLLLALAADSFLNGDAVAGMVQERALFSPANQRGRVPGEGSAALLLASAAWSSLPGAAPALARLHRASMARRDKSADAAGRVSPATLQQAVTDALDGSGVKADQIKFITSDADHRASRTGEVFETVQELLPHLDPGTDALCLGMGCGDLGLARLLACVALTVNKVKSSEAPAIVLTTFPSLERSAVILVPPVPPLDESAAAATQAAA
jgi:hypothetical protein